MAIAPATTATNAIGWYTFLMCEKRNSKTV